jgi:spore coat protein A, manganese oxidase
MSWQDMSNKITRREILYLGTGLAAVSATPSLLATSEVRAPVIQRFQRPLPIPPILTPVRTDSTTDYYEMTQRESEVEILPGLRTTIWGVMRKNSIKS